MSLYWASVLVGIIDASDKKRTQSLIDSQLIASFLSLEQFHYFDEKEEEMTLEHPNR